ncbi:MAG: beta-propeller domain-containing protein, partial [Planctomycetota bacterium]
ADEHGPYLRIASTISNSYSGNWSGRSENVLFVLQDDGGVFETIGSMQNLALNETMRSIRYMGDRAFLTTARDVDPLFVIDLTDPQDPHALGHLTLPGFTDYMQLIGEDLLLTVGKNTPRGAFGPVQVTLFDVSDLTQPRPIDEYTFERFSTSEAQIDHHAFGYFATHGLLAIPTVTTYVERVDEDGDGYRETRKSVREDHLAVLRIGAGVSGDAVDLVSEISHDTSVRRSGYIGDKLYSIAHDSIKVVDVTDPTVVLAELTVVDERPPTITPVELYPAQRVARSADAVALAKSDLAERLDQAASAAALVAIEPAGSIAGDYDVVLRVGDQHYLYATYGDELAILTDSQYEFAEVADSGAWNDIVSPDRPLRGDFDGDHDIDRRDLARWETSFGQSPGGDSDRDGDSDGADFLAWQRRRTGPTTTDLDGDRDVDGNDFLALQRGATPLTPTARDMLAAWEAAFGEITPVGSEFEAINATAVAAQFSVTKFVDDALMARSERESYVPVARYGLPTAAEHDAQHEALFAEDSVADLFATFGV